MSAKAFPIILTACLFVGLPQLLSSQWPKSDPNRLSTTDEWTLAIGGCAIQGSQKAIRLRDLQIKETFGKNDRENDLFVGLSIGYAQMADAFGVDPDYGIYEDVPPNALAIQGQLARANSRDGTILVGRHLIEQEKKQDARYWGASVTLIYAHEFAHIYQFKRGLRLPNPAFELHADFLAGWFMGISNQRTNGLYANMEAASTSLFNKGDYEFDSVNAHGTPEERLRAMRAGYDLGARGKGLEDSYTTGIDVLKGYGS